MPVAEDRDADASGSRAGRKASNAENLGKRSKKARRRKMRNKIKRRSSGKSDDAASSGSAAAAKDSGAPDPLSKAAVASAKAAKAASNARETPKFVVPPHAPPAEMRSRHWGMILSFILFVMAPVGTAGWYLYERADDQYASTLGFSVRKEEAQSASDVLGGLAGLSGASSSDTDVLYEFIQSQELVERIDARLDLRTIYTRPQDDPYFALKDNASIEDLVSYWQNMVTIVYDGTNGLIEVRVLAFTAEDAHAIAQAVFDESSAMINSLTAIARDDATRYAREELEIAITRLKEARTTLTEFRSRTQIVDPQADIAGQMGLLNTLQAQLASALIELDLLRDNTRENDPRIRQAEQKIEVIENRIAEERKKFGIGESGQGNPAYAQLIGDYESLVVDREFAEKTYLTALANYDAAVAEASRQSRYLAAHINPTLAQDAEYPQRATILGLVALFSFVVWGTLALLYYSIRDRR